MLNNDARNERGQDRCRNFVAKCRLQLTSCYIFQFAKRLGFPACALSGQFLNQFMSSPTGPSSGEDRIVSASLALLRELGPALRSHDREQIVAIVGRLADLNAPVGEQWQQLANLAANYGEVGLAHRAIDLFVAANSGSTQAIYQKASLLEKSGRLRDAYELLRSLPVSEPTPAANAFSRGTSALFLGQIEEAVEYLERATRLQPDSGAAWLSLAMSTNLASRPDVAQRLFEAVDSIKTAPPAQLAAYHYAVGKAQADLANPAAAFAAFAKGAGYAKSLAAFDREADQRDAQDSIAGFSAETIEELSGRGRKQDGRTIFVTGLPRSGTTLVEQILTSHGDVHDGSEIDRLPLLAHELRGRSPEVISRYVQSRGQDAAGQLWNHWMDERFGVRGRVVDKSLSSTRLIGLVACLLPDAPIVWLKRNPLDCAWSCFRTFFEGRFPWSYDLAEIAWHFRQEEDLREHWASVLGDRLLVVPYEELVTEPEDWIRRILSHCGLTEEPQVFTPHLTRRAVTTASVTQVREPITRAAIGSAGPYTNFLAPFVVAYQS